ncbi:hypothetical protein [Nitrosopumilus sp. S4]
MFDTSMTIEQLVQIATIFGVIIALSTLAWQIKGQRTQLKEDKKARSIEIASNYIQRIFSEPYAIIIHTISYSELKNKPITIIGNGKTDVSSLVINEFELVKFLVEMEMLSLFINENNIETKYAYEVFSSVIFKIFNNNAIKDYMKQNTDAQSDNHDQLKNAYRKLLEYRNKKLKLDK